MIRKSTLGILVLAVLTGCATVPMESPQATQAAKKFEAPTGGNAGLYIYRYGSFGGALKKDVWVNGQCLGETAPNMFFYKEVPGDQEYKVSTESEFSPNDLAVKVENGQNYFIRQYMKFGVFVGGAGLELVEAERGMKDIGELKLAQQGTCSK